MNHTRESGYNGVEGKSSHLWVRQLTSVDVVPETSNTVCAMATESKSPANSFLFLFRNAGPDTHEHLSPQEREQLTKAWNDWYGGLAAEGKVQHGRPLGLEGRVVSGTRGQWVMDGPYAETKEIVGGYFFLTVADLDEATEIAKHCPGLPLGLTVEVRPVVDTSPVLDGVRGRGPQ
jgi:hypothetical protein